MDDSLRFFLSALSLNPKATHLWHHVRSTVFHMGKDDWKTHTHHEVVVGQRLCFLLSGRYDVLEAIDNRNIESLRRDVPVSASVFVPLTVDFHIQIIANALRVKIWTKCVVNLILQHKHSNTSAQMQMDV